LCDKIPEFILLLRLKFVLPAYLCSKIEEPRQNKHKADERVIQGINMPLKASGKANQDGDEDEGAGAANPGRLFNDFSLIILRLYCIYRSISSIEGSWQNR